MIMTYIYNTVCCRYLVAFFIVCPEKGGHDCPHRTDGEVQPKRYTVCVSLVTNFGTESSFADSCPNAASPDFLLTRKFADVTHIYVTLLVISVSGIQSFKKCILNIGIKPTFYTFCCSNMLTLLLIS